jgi:hypothetical protein
MGWDEVCDNQRWANKALNGHNVYNVRAVGRAAGRKYSSYTGQQNSQFRTLIQGQRSPQAAQCQLDEFPMGNLVESGNNNPQACRMVNGRANGSK